MQISLSIKKDINRDYLKGIFEVGANKNLILSKDHLFGKALVSRIRYTKLPVKESIDETTINFELPIVKSLKQADHHFLSILQDDQEKLNDDLEVMFNLDLFTFYNEGLQLKMMKKDIIEAFILSRKICLFTGDPHERIKKRMDRAEHLKLNKYREMLLKRAYYRHNLVHKELERFNSLIYN